MLDTKSTFDDAVTRYARDPAQALAIQQSRHYRNLCNALSGTQEYMAVEKLYQLHQESGFDLVVVDTPPTRRAVDFLSAPRHLTRFLDNRALRMLAHARPHLHAGRRRCRAGAAEGGNEDRWSRNGLRYRGLLAGLRWDGSRNPKPGQAVLELFTEPSTAFVLVVAPRQDVIAEGRYFAESVGQANIAVQALVVNRLRPDFDARPAESLPVAGAGKSGRVRSEASAEAFAVLYGNWEELRAEAKREESCVAALAAQVAPAPVARVPLMDSDVHDLEGVQTVADHLFGLSDDGDR